MTGMAASGVSAAAMLAQVIVAATGDSADMGSQMMSTAFLAFALLENISHSLTLGWLHQFISNQQSITPGKTDGTPSEENGEKEKKKKKKKNEPEMVKIKTKAGLTDTAAVADAPAAPAPDGTAAVADAPVNPHKEVKLKKRKKVDLAKKSMHIDGLQSKKEPHIHLNKEPVAEEDAADVVTEGNDNQPATEESPGLEQSPQEDQAIDDELNDSFLNQPKKKKVVKLDDQLTAEVEKAE
jgi:hypothetical protein